MSLSMRAVALVAACIAFPIVVASPTTIDDVDTTQPLADVLSRSKQERVSWCAAFEDAELLRGNTCQVVQVAPDYELFGATYVHGIPEVGRVNTFIVKISAVTALHTLGNYRDMEDANALPPELDILVADPVEPSTKDRGPDLNRRSAYATGWKGKVRGKAKLGEAPRHFGSEKMIPTYLVPFDLEHVPAPEGEDPIRYPEIWFGFKLPDGTVRWPYDTSIFVDWLHPSREMPDEAVTYVNRAVRERREVDVGYCPRRVKFVVDMEQEAGRCAEVRMGGSTEALPMEDGDYHGKAARVGIVHLDDSVVEFFLDCVLEPPSNEVVPVKIDLRF